MQLLPLRSRPKRTAPRLRAAPWIRSGVLCGILSGILCTSPLLVGCKSSAPLTAGTQVPGEVAKADPCQGIWDQVWRWEQEQQAGSSVARSEQRKRARSFGGCQDTGRVSFAMAQALMWGRVAQGRGLSGLKAFRRAEGWAAKAYARDPEFQSGMPRRVLGSMWSLGGQHLPGRDSESGLELLADQLKRYPDKDDNALAMIEALVALGDVDGAHGVYCAYTALDGAWTQMEQEGKALQQRMESVFSDEGLQCPAGEA